MPPEFPVGPPPQAAEYSAETARQRIAAIGEAPDKLRAVVAGLDHERLETRYRNWTIRQIVHHVADSHMHSLIRFKWALTEEQPLIKAYEEADWVGLADSAHAPIDPALTLLDGLHARWVCLLDAMTEQQFSRTFRHPQTGAAVSLWEALGYYPWHAAHHTGQIQWLLDASGQPSA